MNKELLLDCIQEVSKFYQVDKDLLDKKAKKKKLEEFLFDFLKNKFLNILKQDKKAYEIYYKLTWKQSKSYLNLYLDEDFIVPSKIFLKEKYCFIAIYSYFEKEKEIYIESEFLNIFKEILPKPKGCNLEKLNLKGELNYKNDFALDDIKEALAFKKYKIKDLYKKLSIKEFYPKSSYAKRFLAKSIQNYPNETFRKNSLKRIVLDFLDNKKLPNIERIVCSNKTSEKYVRDILIEATPSFKKLLEQLTDEFVSIESILEFIKYNGGIKNFTLTILQNMKISSNEELEEKIVIPILKGYLFFLSIFGVIEIMFDNTGDFEGLKGVRITQFGKFVIGKEKNIEIKQKEKLKEKIICSDIKPLIKIENPTFDTKAKIFLFAKATKNGFLLDNKVFLDGNKSEVQKKIEDFRKFIKNPTKPIQDFIKNIEENLDSIEEESFIVLKVDEKIKDKIIKINEELGNILIPAQGYRILIDKKDYEKVKKALNKEGIFI